MRETSAAMMMIENITMMRTHLDGALFYSVFPKSEQRVFYASHPNGVVIPWDMDGFTE